MCLGALSVDEVGVFAAVDRCITLSVALSACYIVQIWDERRKEKKISPSFATKNPKFTVN